MQETLGNADSIVLSPKEVNGKSVIVFSYKKGKENRALHAVVGENRLELRLPAESMRGIIQERKANKKIKTVSKKETIEGFSDSESIRFAVSNTASNEGEIIKTNVSYTTAPQLSVDTVETFASTNSISEGGEKVNSFSKNSSKNTAGKEKERFALNKYTDKQKNNWKNSKNIIVCENKNQLREFVQESRLNNKFDKKIYFGSIGTQLAERVNSRIGLNIENFNCSLSAYEVRKIFKDHGNEETERLKGQRAITEEDIFAIPDVIQNATSITRSLKDYDGKPAIIFSQENKLGKITVVAIVSDKHLDLRVQTEYAHPSNKKRTLATVLGEQAPNDTPKAARGTDSFTNSISEGGEKVNSFSENSSKKDIRYALPERAGDIQAKDVEILRSIGRKSVNDFTGEEIKKAEPWAKKFYLELGEKSPFFRAWFGDWRAYDSSKIKTVEVDNINFDEVVMESGDYVNEDTGWSIHAGRTLLDETKHYAKRERISAKALKDIDEILKNAVLLDTEISTLTSNKKSRGTAFMHKLYAPILYEEKPYIAKINVEEYFDYGTEIVKRKGYHLAAIKIEAADGFFIDSSTTEPMPDATSINSIRDLFGFVNSLDEKFSPKNVNPVLLNEDGTPKAFYHGTNTRFSEFKAEEIAAREGSYFFAENEEDAKAYGKNVMKVYLSAEKLADYDNQPSEFYRLKDKKAQVEWLKRKGYDGWYADMDSDGWGEVSVFYSTQIKSATSNIGTFDKTNPDIRYAVEGEKEQIAGGKSQELKPLEMKRAENFARVHIEGYEQLSTTQKLEVEWTLASAWRYGVGESEAIALARLAAKTKVGIGFAEMKKKGKDGKKVNVDGVCYKRGGHLTVYLNPESGRSVERATLHELAHVLEGTDGYEDIQKLAMEYYEAHPSEKAEIDETYRSLYEEESVEYAEDILPSELTAHYVEKMLEKRNVLAKMTEKKPSFMKRCIRWLQERLSALKNNDLAFREVERLSKKFISTFNINKGNLAIKKSAPKYSVQEIDGKKIVVIDTDQHIFDGITDVKQLKKVAREYIMNHFRNDVYKTTDGKGVTFTRKGAKKIANTEHNVKIRISTELDNFIKAAEYSHTAENEKGTNPEFDYFDYYDVKFMLGDQVFAATVNIGVNSQNGVGIFYEVSNIKKDTTSNSFGGENATSPASRDIFINSISEGGEKVNSFSEKTSKKADEKAKTGRSEVKNENGEAKYAVGKEKRKPLAS